MSIKGLHRLDAFRHFEVVRTGIACIAILAIVFSQSLLVGAAPFVTDTFTGTAGTALESHTGETGATWAKNAAVSGSNLQIDSANRLRSAIAGTSVYYSSGVPATNEYDVEADVVYISNPGTRIIVGVNGRYSTTANTGYTTWYDTSTGRWHLYVTTGAGTVELGNYAQALTPGTSYHIKLELRTATKKVFIDGVERISSADNSNTTLGRAGVVTGFTTASGTGLALDNFSATDAPVTPATAYSFSGSSTGVVGKTYTYTITPNASYTGTITPATSGTGTFSPTSLSFSNESTAKTFTYTPTDVTESPHIISVSSSPGLSDPAAISMVVRAQASQFVHDTFTGSAAVNMTAHTGEVGASWTRHPAASGNLVLDNNNRVYGSDAVPTNYYASGLPASPDYIVQADITLVSTATDYISVVGREDTAANTSYFFNYSNTRARWELWKLVGGTLTNIGTNPASFGSVGTTRNIALSMIGTSIQGYVDGVLMISVTDSSITAAGRAGIGSFGAVTTTTGQHMDNFAAYDLAGPASSYTLTGPTHGSANTASTTFTVRPNGFYTGTITPATNGSGTFSPASLSFSNESGAKTFTYTPNSASGSPHVISVSSSPSLSNPASLNYVVTNGVTNFGVTAANWFWSPYNTYFNGSTSATMLTMGAYSKLNFTGTSAILSLDVSALVNASIPATNYPKIAYSIDGASRIEYQLTPSTTTLVLASGLPAGTHSLYFSMISDSVFVDHWNVPVSPVKVTGLALDGGASITSPTLKPARAVFFGDSGTAAYDVNSGDNSIAANDASKGWVPHIASFLNAEFAQIGYGGQGFSQGAADGTTPAFPSTWHSYYSGQTRLTGGKFVPTPDYVVLAQGGNGGVANDGLIVTAIANMRSSTSASTKIFVMVPITGAGRANIILGYDNYRAANPSDTQVYLIDVGNLTYPSTDGVHPTEHGHQIVADAVMGRIRATASPSMTASVTTVVKGSSNTIQLSGVDTYWQPGAPGSPLFTVSGGEGAMITNQTVISSTAAQIVLSAGSKSGTVTITDNTANVSTTIQIIEPNAPPTSGSSTPVNTGGKKKSTQTSSASSGSTAQEPTTETPAEQTDDGTGQTQTPAYNQHNNNSGNGSNSSSKKTKNFNVIPWIFGGSLALAGLVVIGVTARALLLGARTRHY